MKKLYFIFGLMLLITGSAIAESYNLPKKPGKHKSHKKSKKKKSKYFYNFQH